MPDSLNALFSSTGFPARWNCGPAWQQEPWWGWLHITSDMLIWFAYFAIPLILVVLARKRKDLPFPRIIYLFAAFILACGATHLMEAIIFYWPAYRLSALLKLTTAAISLATVGSLFDIIPKALLLKSPLQSAAEVERKTRELQRLAEELKVEVAERRWINEKLRDSREMLQLALTASDAGFFNWDLASDRVTFDQGELRLTGLTAKDGGVHVEQYMECIDPEYRDGVRAGVKASIEGKADYHGRFPFFRPSGERIWLEVQACVVRDPTGKPLRFIGLNHDVTEQVARESELDETAREAKSASQQKSRFVAQVSHEIRTPLTAMLGCLDSLLPTVAEGDLRDTLRIVRSQGETLRILVNDVLDLSKIEAGRLEIRTTKVNIAQLLAESRSLMDPLAAEKGLELILVAKSPLPQFVECDPYRVKQVLINLVGNAIKFTDEGSIRIEVLLDQLTAESSELLLEVRDTGRGIPEEQRSQIFEEYVQSQESQLSGAGLGLAICQRLIDLMDGTISVHSELGSGSTFAVRLPIGQIDRTTLKTIDLAELNMVSGTDPCQSDADRLPLKVLAADDTRAIQLVLKRLIGPMVDELQVVGNGEQALQQALSAEQSDRPFDVVMMDIQMPEMDGTEAARRLRAEGFSKPIIALTAGAMQSERDACMGAGCTHFLAKPINVRELRLLLEQIA